MKFSKRKLEISAFHSPLIYTFNIASELKEFSIGRVSSFLEKNGISQISRLLRNVSFCAVAIYM